MWKQWTPSGMVPSFEIYRKCLSYIFKPNVECLRCGGAIRNRQRAKSYPALGLVPLLVESYHPCQLMCKDGGLRDSLFLHPTSPTCGGSRTQQIVEIIFMNKETALYQYETQQVERIWWLVISSLLSMMGRSDFELPGILATVVGDLNISTLVNYLPWYNN